MFANPSLHTQWQYNRQSPLRRKINTEQDNTRTVPDHDFLHNFHNFFPSSPKTSQSFFPFYRFGRNQRSKTKAKSIRTQNVFTRQTGFEPRPARQVTLPRYRSQIPSAVGWSEAVSSRYHAIPSAPPMPCDDVIGAPPRRGRRGSKREVIDAEEKCCCRRIVTRHEQ